MRAFDWAKTSLGPIKDWPQSLKTATGILLQSPVPMVMLWGEPGYMIYNDGYGVFAGERHPRLLGSQVRQGWPEVADYNDNIMKLVLGKGETASYRDRMLELDRKGTGVLEPCWVDVDYSPVPGDDGERAGVICIVAETTERILAERRADAEEVRQRDLLQKMPGFCAVLTGPDHRFDYVNDAYVTIAGGRPLLGLTVRQAFPELAGQGFYEWLDQVYETGERRVARGVPVIFEGEDEPRFIEFVYEPMRDGAGAVTGIFVGGYEVTEAHRSTQALQRSEEQLRLATDHAEIALWDLDLVTDTLFWPARLKAMFGISAPVPISMVDFYAGLHPDDLQATTDAFALAIDPVVRALYDVEYRTVGAEDGVVRWIAAKGRGLFDETGACVRVIGTALDITARKLAEQRLQELNADLERRVAEQVQERGQTWQISPHLLSVISLTDGRFIRVNPAWTTTLGWSQAQLESGGFKDFVHPEDIDRSYEGFARLQAGEVVFDFENRYRTASGDYRWLSWVAVPEGDRLYSTARDITAEKAQAAALAASNTERDRIWRNSQDVITVIDLRGVVQSVNPAATEWLGWTSSDMVGRSILDFIHPEDRPPLQDGALLEERYATPRVFHNRFRHKNGSYRALAWLSGLYDGFIYSSGRDVTLERAQAEALQAAEEHLRQSQKMEAVGQLTGGIAHDFNNLLTGITGSLEMMQSRLAQGRGNEIDRYIGVAQGAARRAASLTQRLLAFSRRQTLDPKPTDVNRLVVGMEELIRRSIGPQVELEVVGAGGLWPALVDPSQLENALLNLCINGRDAMPDGGRLTIETANKWLDERAAKERDLPPGQYLQLCVTDTGTGMTPEVAARAFDPFFTTKPLGEGTGLGLSMIYGFVRQSGGQVRIYSELGKGTTMCLYFPRHQGVAEPDEARIAFGEAAEGPVQANGKVVLVVDDEPSVRMLVREIVEEAGYVALEAGDAPSGLRLLQSSAAIDLLITDVGLPGGMNGRQIADAARVLRPDLKVLFITGYAENAAVGNGHLEAGMQVLTKPFAMDTLASRIRGMIQG